jgi:ABC-type phosphate/phosphonate transport system substrate-binding protein
MFSRFAFAAIAASFFISSVNAQELVLAINEGVTYADGGPTAERYKPLLDLLSKELKRPIKVQKVDKYADFEKGLAESKYDLVFIHPAHVGLKAVRSNNYVGLVTAKGFTDYRARVMVKQDSPLKSMQDLKDRKIGVPSIESITTFMFTADLRQRSFNDTEKKFIATRYQDAVPFMIENGFVDAGVTASGAVAKAWVAKGGRIIGETEPVPIKQFLASKKIEESDRAKVQSLLLNLSENEPGKNALSKISMSGFVPWNNEQMTNAAKRLGL